MSPECRPDCEFLVTCLARGAGKHLMVSLCFECTKPIDVRPVPPSMLGYTEVQFIQDLLHSNDPNYKMLGVDALAICPRATWATTKTWCADCAIERTKRDWKNSLGKTY